MNTQETTLELVKAHGVIERHAEVSEHQEKLERVLGTRDTYDSGRIKEAKRLGFYISVNYSFALKFKYHASIKGNTVRTGSHVIRYVGDIPDSVLDNIETYSNFLASPGHSVVTVHSLEVLPIQLEATFPLCDPVAIGWFGWISFVKGLGGWRAVYQYEKFPTMGVILGIWDKEKELEVI